MEKENLVTFTARNERKTSKKSKQIMEMGKGFPRGGVRREGGKEKYLNYNARGARIGHG